MTVRADAEGVDEVTPVSDDEDVVVRLAREVERNGGDLEPHLGTKADATVIVTLVIAGLVVAERR